jgi:hypothetical protein
VQHGIVIQLNEGFERDAKALAVIEHGVVMVGNAPRPRVDVEAFVEFAGLFRSAKLGEGVAAAQGPVAPAWPAIELEDLDLIAGLAQLEGRRHPREPRTENKDGGSFWIAAQFDRALVGRLGCEPQTCHRVIHRCTAGNRADQ